MRILNGNDVKQLTDLLESIDTVERAYVDYSAGKAKVPLRCNLELDHPEKYSLFMPGFLPEAKGLGVKVVSVLPTNFEKGLPNTLGAMLLFDPVTGVPTGLLDATYITELRTGAATGVATKYLADPDASSLALIGTGGMAAQQLQAVCLVRNITEVYVYNRTRSKAESFIAQMKQTFNRDIIYHLADSSEHAVRPADIIVTSTTSAEPVLHYEWLKPSAHVNAIGAFNASMQEVDTATVAHAKLRVVDGISAASVAGDIAIPLREGVIASSDLIEIGALIGEGFNRDSVGDGVTFYKSVGLSVLDIAVAIQVLDKASRQNIGADVEWPVAPKMIGH